MLDHKYKVFYHLAKNPNTTKVAEELLLTQPAISKSIKELEKELGISLFLREKGRMQLTEAGKYLYDKTDFLIQREREINYEIGKMRMSIKGTLYLGASTTLSQYILPEVLARFTTRHPQISISMSSGNTDQIEHEILAGNLQLAFIEGNPSLPDIHYIPYIRDEIVLVTAKDTPVEENISPEKFIQLPFVFREKGSGTYHIIRKHLKEAGIDINHLTNRLVLGSTEGIKHYLLHSDCFALLSIYSVRDELSAGKLKLIEMNDLCIHRMFYIIHRQGEPDPYARQFMEFALNQKK